MNSPQSRLAPYAPYFLAILRIVTALLFISHGTAKLIGFPSMGFQPPFLSLMGFASIIEITGGILLILGLFTRVAAFVLAGEMAVAYFMAHAPQNFYPLLNQGESAILFCFIFLYLVFAGPGAWSVDGGRARAA